MAPNITIILSSLSLGGFSGLLVIHFSSTELSKQTSASLGEFGVCKGCACGPGIQSTYFRHLFGDGVNFFLENTPPHWLYRRPRQQLEPQQSPS